MRRLECVSFMRAGRFTGNFAGPVRPGEVLVEERRSTRTGYVCSGTLACRRCDAPVSAGADGLTLTEPLVCPFCHHRAPVRDFLSLAVPTRPARVTVRVSGI